MTNHRLPAAALATIFALGVTGAGLAAQRPHGLAAAAATLDDDEHEHHDNGKHNGWYKHDENEQGDDDNGRHSHHRHGQGLTGRIVSINGNTLGVQLTNGRTVYVNDAPAVNSGRTPNLYVGEVVRINVGNAPDGTLYANSIAQANNDGSGYGYGYGDNGYGSLTNIVGYALGGIDGNGNFQLRTGDNPVTAVGGTTYNVHVDGNTRVDTAVGNLGQRIRVVGRLNGNTILATRISG